MSSDHCHEFMPISPVLFKNSLVTCPRLDHIFFQLGPTPPMPPSLHGLPAHTYVGTLPRWEPM